MVFMAEEALEKLYLLFTFVELCGPDLLKVAELRWKITKMPCKPIPLKHLRKAETQHAFRLMQTAVVSVVQVKAFQYQDKSFAYNDLITRAPALKAGIVVEECRLCVHRMRNIAAGRLAIVTDPNVPVTEFIRLMHVMDKERAHPAVIAFRGAFCPPTGTA